VLVAPLGSAIGLDADVVFAVGLAEKLPRAQTGMYVQTRAGHATQSGIAWRARSTG